MKRIAIFIDGTWNRPDAEHPTNVLRLSRCVKYHDRDGIPQATIYAAGVGSGRGNTRLGRWMDRTFGGAFGWGLLQIIEDVYRQLIFQYEPGDEIYIFGFSRGAFAARSLAGLIRSCGIPPRRHIGRVPEALAMYVARGADTKPDDPKSQAFRKDYAPYTATSESEFNSRRKRGDDQVIRLTLAYIGIWDTVKALGWPAFLHFTDRQKAKYAFHDAALSSSVMSARHAVAIDERRATFPQLLWDNLDRLNSDRRGAYLQQYFPGDHGSVGGGGSRVGLSSIALHWVAIGAEQAGLDLQWEEVDRVADHFDPMAPLSNKFGPVNLMGGVLKAVTTDRAGPEEEVDLSLAALDRYLADEGYRPRTLAALKDELFDMDAGERDHLRRLMIERDGGPTHVVGDQVRPRFEVERKWV